MIGTVVKFITETKALEVLGLKVKKKKTLKKLGTEETYINIIKAITNIIPNWGKLLC